LKLLQGGATDGEAIKARSNMITIERTSAYVVSLSHSCAERSRIKLATLTWESGDFMFEEVE